MKINTNRINGLISQEKGDFMTSHWEKGLLSLLMTQTCLPRRNIVSSLPLKCHRNGLAMATGLTGAININ
jgi:hypothetical protein